MAETEALPHVAVVPYDVRWATDYERARLELLQLACPDVLAVEHIGSTAVPGLAAKPIIDMMAAVPDEAAADRAARRLQSSGYEVIPTGMEDRLFLRKQESEGRVFQLHIVAAATWTSRHERLMRDYLLAHPEAARAYGELKHQLAEAYAHDPLGYTRAKTKFVQQIVDNATDELGIGRIDVWPD